jgi:hypothetical protein
MHVQGLLKPMSVAAWNPSKHVQLVRIACL